MMISSILGRHWEVAYPNRITKMNNKEKKNNINDKKLQISTQTCSFNMSRKLMFCHSNVCF